MSRQIEVIKAKTLKELEEKARVWINTAYHYGGEATEIIDGWDPKRVKKTAEGYEIGLHAHI